MAKSRQKPGKLRLSERIAGVRIPRSARQAMLIRFLNSSAGKLLIAEALAVAAGAMGVKRRRSSGESRRSQGDRVTLEEARTRLSYACLEAMKAFRTALAEKDRVITYEGSESVASDETGPAPRRRKPPRRSTSRKRLRGPS